MKDKVSLTALCFPRFQLLLTQQLQLCVKNMIVTKTIKMKLQYDNET